jgi:hypothetical protein
VEVFAVSILDFFNALVEHSARAGSGEYTSDFTKHDECQFLGNYEVNGSSTPHRWNKDGPVLSIDTFCILQAEFSPFALTAKSTRPLHSPWPRAQGFSQKETETTKIYAEPAELFFNRKP